MDELKARADEVEADISAMKKAAAKQLADGSALKHAMAAHEAAVEELRGRHADIIEAAQMQQASFAPCVFTNQDSSVWPSSRVPEDVRTELETRKTVFGIRQYMAAVTYSDTDDRKHETQS